MVQIKPDGALFTVNCSITFISHMVQIKQGNAGTDDENRFAFISHMVQIKRGWKRWHNLYRKRIYIPYGSDKTLSSPFSASISSSFISHMVQIKRKGRSDNTAIWSDLYPIWFR